MLLRWGVSSESRSNVICSRLSLLQLAHAGYGMPSMHKTNKEQLGVKGQDCVSGDAKTRLGLDL